MAEQNGNGASNLEPIIQLRVYPDGNVEMNTKLDSFEVVKALNNVSTYLTFQYINIMSRNQPTLSPEFLQSIMRLKQ